MGDDKEPFVDTLSMKEKETSVVAPLPAPAIAPAARSESATRRWGRRLFKHVLFFGFVYACIWRWSQLLKPQVEEETARWLTNPFAAQRHWRYGQYGNEHSAARGPLLNGKLAEELFLCVILSALIRVRCRVTVPQLQDDP